MPKKTTPAVQEKIVHAAMEDVMHESMIPYAEYVIMDRAIPRVEDGLKPVQRRILYTMYELSLTPDKPHRKSARIVGDCLGKYHPHGDTSVYDAMVRMAQDFNMSEKLVDGHGNFGSVDGDPAAAMRYTEARMTQLAMELLRDIEKDTVPFSLNFDDTLKEPDLLPARYPNLLVNGASGIAVGLATNIPPHNLGECIDGAVAVLEKPDISAEKLMKYVKAPDFPTGGLLVGTDELETAYLTGRGKIALRAKCEIEPQKNGKQLIVITEMPYQVNKANALERILKLSEEKKSMFSGITDIRDESDRNGMRAVIEIKKDADAQKILQLLYKYSDLQINFGMNMVAIAGGKPCQMGLQEILRHYIAYQKLVVRKRTQFDLDAALKRAHILEGLIIAVDNIDRVIKIIRSSHTVAEAKKRLMEEFKLSDIQAQAILDMRLQRLTGLSIIELRKEYAELQKLIAELQAILSDEGKLCAVIKKELLEVKKKYAQPRRTVISAAPAEIEVDEKEFAVFEDVTICVTDAGIRRLGGKTAAAKAPGEDERVLFSLNVKSNARVCFFTSLGNMYSTAAGDVPEPKGKEKFIIPAGLFQGWEDGERIMYVCAPSDADAGRELLFFTRKGQVKRTALSEYQLRVKKTAAISLRAGDSLVSITEFDENASALLITQNGMSICFALSEVSATGRNTAGVKAIALELEDEVISAFVSAGDGEVLVVTDRGYAKRTLVCDYELQRRGGKGLKTIDFKKNSANGSKIAGAILVTMPVDVTVVQKYGGKTTFSSDETMIAPRASKGMPAVTVLMDDVVAGVYTR